MKSKEVWMETTFADGAFDGFPNKPRFKKGDRVFLIVEDSFYVAKGGSRFGTVRHIRAKLRMEVAETITEHRKEKRGKLKKAAPIVTYGYQVGFDDENIVSTVIEENLLQHANPLLRMVDET